MTWKHLFWWSKSCSIFIFLGLYTFSKIMNSFINTVVKSFIDSNLFPGTTQKRNEGQNKFRVWVQNVGNFFLLKSGCNVPKHFHIFKKKDTGSLAHIFQIIDVYLEEYQEPEEGDFHPLTCYTALYCPSLESTRLSLLVPRIALKRMNPNYR